MSVLIDDPKTFDYAGQTDEVLVWLMAGGDERAAKELARRGSSSKRALTPSTIERTIEKSGRACPQCEANNDPNKVPVHPGCHCGVQTVSLSRGVDPEDAQSIAERANESLLHQFGLDPEADIPEAFKVAEDTVAVIAEEGFRFADFSEWFFSTAENLNSKTELWAMIVTEPQQQQQEAAAEGQAPPGSAVAAETLAALGTFFVLARLYPHIGGEKGASTFNVSKHLNEIQKKKAEELQKELYLISPDATPSDLSQAFAALTDGATPSPQSSDAVAADTAPKENPQ